MRHDLAIPGSRANIDHVVITEHEVFVIGTKNYFGELTFNGETLNYRGGALTCQLASCRWQARVAPQVSEVPTSLPCKPVMCILGAELPHRRLELEGVIVVVGVAALVGLITEGVS